MCCTVGGCDFFVNILANSCAMELIASGCFESGLLKLMLGLDPRVKKVLKVMKGLKQLRH